MSASNLIRRIAALLSLDAGFTQDIRLQSRLVLQRHADAYAGTAELNLGHLRHQSDNRRMETVGFGAEIKTEHNIAMRAGKGMLVSTDSRAGATGPQLDSSEAIAQIDRSSQLQNDLAELARKHAVVASATTASAAPSAASLRAIDALAHSLEILKTSANKPGQADAGYSEPHLQLSSPAGIAVATPTNAVISAALTTAVSAGQDVSLASQGNSHIIAKDGISLFTYGKTEANEKPNQESGIRMPAASGKVSSRSQSAASRLVADKAITIASVTQAVNITAMQHVLLHAQGAALKLQGGNIELSGPGKIEFKASMKEFSGPHDGSTGLPPLPKPMEIFNEAFVVKNEKTGEIMAHVPYRMESANGVVLEGVTDAPFRWEASHC